MIDLTTPAVPSGLSEILFSFLSLNVYSSLLTISEESPTDLLKSFSLSKAGVLIS